MRLLLYLVFPLFLLACATTSTIHTQPIGAEVHINGQRCGVSPCIHHERYGFPDRMRVQIRSPGYEVAEFFVDTQPPVASFLLYGFGSYIFHSFSKEYRFALKPLVSSKEDDIPMPGLLNTTKLRDAELSNIIEQCLFWHEQRGESVWDNQFFDRSMLYDCNVAASAIQVPREQAGDPSPALARSFIRYVYLRNSNTMAPITLSWSIPVLCGIAKIEYAKRVGADAVPSTLFGFDELCPDEAQQLRRE